jgi:hypothetical protein
VKSRIIGNFGFPADSPNEVAQDTASQELRAIGPLRRRGEPTHERRSRHEWGTRLTRLTQQQISSGNDR